MPYRRTRKRRGRKRRGKRKKVYKRRSKRRGGLSSRMRLAIEKYMCPQRVYVNNYEDVMQTTPGLVKWGAQEITRNELIAFADDLVGSTTTTEKVRIKYFKLALKLHNPGNADIQVDIWHYHPRRDWTVNTATLLVDDNAWIAGGVPTTKYTQPNVTIFKNESFVKIQKVYKHKRYIIKPNQTIQVSSTIRNKIFDTAFYNTNSTYTTIRGMTPGVAIRLMGTVGHDSTVEGGDAGLMGGELNIIGCLYAKGCTLLSNKDTLDFGSGGDANVLAAPVLQTEHAEDSHNPDGD